MLKIEKKYDVAVIGGGFGGTMAAVAAARQGCNVLLVERYGFLGGMATAALVNPFMSYRTRTPEGELKPVNNGGLFKEVLDRLTELGGLHPEGSVFNEEILKLVFDRMCKESGVDVLFHSFLMGAQVQANKITAAKVVNKSGEMLIHADYFIDASGDADLAYLAGCEVKVGRDEDGACQPMTLCCRMGNLSEDRYDPYKNKEEYIKNVWDVFFRLKQEGKIKAPRVDVLMFRHMVSSMMHFNSTRVINKSALNVFELSESEMEGREQVYELFQFMKNYVKGYEDAQLVMTGSQIGVRETRRVMGHHILHEDELLNCVKFEDSIARGCYSIDIHNPKGTDTVIKKIQPGEHYTIPYRSIVAKDVDNLAVAGRPISATHAAHSAIRVMPICASIGEGAGTAAAVAVREKKAYREVDVRMVQAVLEKNGALY